MWKLPVSIACKAVWLGLKPRFLSPAPERGPEGPLYHGGSVDVGDELRSFAPLDSRGRLSLPEPPERGAEGPLYHAVSRLH